jgi:hypothetical protein
MGNEIKKDVEEVIVLSDVEKQQIENFRKESGQLESFKKEYESLVERTGFAWAVDTTSPLNNIKLGVAKVR